TSQLFFFFQAEDGIRDRNVTGVQTCALPIYPGAELVAAARARDVNVVTVPGPTAVAAALSVSGLAADRYLFLGFLPRKGGERRRSEERRVGKECRSRGAADR